MKGSRIILIVFVILGTLFVIGSIFKIQILELVAIAFIVPVLLLFYRFKTNTFVLPIIASLLLFYVRDIFLVLDFEKYLLIIMSCFFVGMVILLTCTITGLQKSKIHFTEYISYVIMYVFLAFLVISIGGMVPQAVPSYKFATYLYLVLLTLFLAVTFTGYLMKSHVASLWLMLTSAFLLTSELSLFFKLYIIEDISVVLFYPIFHVFAYYSLIQYALNRRQTKLLPYF